MSMEDNATWGDRTVVLILKTAHERGFSFGTSRQIDNIASSVGIWPKNSFWTLIHKKIWKVETDWLWTGFSPPRLSGCHDTFSWMLVFSTSQAGLLSNSFQGFRQNCEFVELQVRFWIWIPWKQHGRVFSHCLCFRMVPGFHLRDTMDHWS